MPLWKQTSSEMERHGHQASEQRSPQICFNPLHPVRQSQETPGEEEVPDEAEGRQISEERESRQREKQDVHEAAKRTRTKED